MKPEEWRKAATERAKAQVRERTVGNYGSVLQTFRIAFDAVGLDGNLTQGKVVSAMEYLIAHGYTYVILNSIRAAIGWKSRQPGCRKWRAGLGDKVDGYIAGVARTVGTAPLQEATGVEEADLNAIATKYLDLKGTLPGRKITTMVCSFYGVGRSDDMHHITRECISEPQPGLIKMVKPRGKCDQRGEGNPIYFADGPQAGNAYQWLRGHLPAKEWLPKERLFTGHSALNQFLKVEFTALHPGPNLRYTTHSLRRGGATCAVAHGVSERALMAIGGWKTYCFTRYVRQPALDAAAWTAG